MIKWSLYLLLSIIPLASISQQNVCNSKFHNQFDFWQGKWEVKDTSGKVVGINTVSKDYDNCLLREEWESSSINRGTSYNYFNPSDSSWNQLWLDNQGSILKLKGRFDGKRMILRSDVFKGRDNKMHIHQISWTAVNEDKVIQNWEVYSKSNIKENQLFYGIYNRIK